MTITLCNQKGGAGKTTLTMLLAMAFSSVGKTVGIIDLDPQATATRWIDQIDDSSITPYNSDDEFDIIIRDTPPMLDARLTRALKDSDLAIVVTSPSPADLWSTQETHTFIKTNAPKAKRVTLFNRVERGRKLSENIDSLSKILGGKTLKSSLPYYSSYQHSLLHGWKSLSKRDRDAIKTTALEITTSV